MCIPTTSNHYGPKEGPRCTDCFLAQKASQPGCKVGDGMGTFEFGIGQSCEVKPRHRIDRQLTASHSPKTFERPPATLRFYRPEASAALVLRVASAKALVFRPKARARGDGDGVRGCCGGAKLEVWHTWHTTGDLWLTC